MKGLLDGCGTGERCGESLQMAFGKKHVEDRKAWLSNFVPGTFLDSEASRVSYDDFVNKVRPPNDLYQFSNATSQSVISALSRVLHVKVHVSQRCD